MIPKKELFHVPITCLPLDEQIMLILSWVNMRASKVVCLANVHMLMEAHHNFSFRKVLHQADLVTPDGKPLVLMLRQLGIFNQNQVSGMDVFLNLCSLSEMTGKTVYFLGSTQDILDKIKWKLNQEYPLLKIAGMKSIPFVPIDEIDKNYDTELIKEINQSGAGIIFVCLGCPKQEIWMSHYQGRIKGVMIGVGAVFSMYAGITPRAPYWVRYLCLEWLYRLLQEPQRLWHRYGATIPPFLYLAMRQLINKEKFTKGSSQSLLDINLSTDINELDTSSNKIGEILYKQGVLSKEDLERAIKEQQQFPHLKLGEILIKNNLISLYEFKYFLRNQNLKLGEILVEKKLIKPSTLEKALIIQKSQEPTKLGEILVKIDALSYEQVRVAIIEQYLRRKGLWLDSKLSDEKQSSRYLLSVDF
ncbi:WecB/TagA/CpsF family glycosyltransferase [Nostoc sp. FACHB-152]|uniref:WecB/TagA/CpsF family glycosyltransferase n=1 Tax=unclassified Nostoc TaxID=2593658 RepID=UPI001686D949|nr:MULTISPECIES: WecB/TagA/CpsF family glycosyltransferase [unclassified Nostoc]MBD2445801.1 WecB/TagA/CpsF family glycosyltransferase [Nostoc sp. FACHB-152]MBD2466915.1 WecB/TagA/CpsF family glycosyltransferase [Nostoc sp. FACHB-145]